MIYDCFTFFDELDLLELRLAELAAVVDRFVLVESPLTFSGKPKPLHFSENRKRYKKYADRIIHVVVDDLPGEGATAWDREAFQRNAILRGLDKAAPDDIIVISDVDELPRPECLRSFSGRPSVLTLRNYYYRLNCYLTQGPEFRLPVITVLHRRDLELPQTARMTARTSDITGAFAVIADGGWHFSYLADESRIRRKIDSFSHQELNIPRYTDPKEVERRMTEAIDLFERPGYVWRYVEIDESFPTVVRENRERYAQYIKPLTAQDRELLKQDQLLSELQGALAKEKLLLSEVNQRLHSVEEELAGQRSAYGWLERSPSYRLGRALTWPARAVVSKLSG